MSDATSETTVKGWLATWLNPILVGALGTIALLYLNDIKNRRVEDFSTLAMQRMDDRADVVALDLTVQRLNDLTQTNQIIITQLQVLIGVMADDTADIQDEVRALQNWQRAVNNPP